LEPALALPPARPTQPGIKVFPDRADELAYGPRFSLDQINVLRIAVEPSEEQLVQGGSTPKYDLIGDFPGCEQGNKGPGEDQILFNLLV
jgi:hypothetical protein